MKTIFKLVLLSISIISLSSCGSDDDITAGNTTNGITVNGNFIPMANAFVAFERNAPFEDAFAVFLSNGDIINAANNELLAQTSTSTVAVLFYDTNGPSVATEDLVSLNVGNYTLDSDTAVVDNIAALTATTTQNGIDYAPTDNISGTEYEMETTGNASLNITAITKDFVTRTGTITFTFNMLDDNGIIITGTYTGTYKMLKGDV